ncbi:unnamed protein product [Gulo gulo]|uniref:Uncharacterized protein n=1 Tax=Gulo gulo TaxID=48420 RepID=A0A9X9Q0D5_GULGU|nr:unnamed protein product [Gulo gulo]
MAQHTGSGPAVCSQLSSQRLSGLVPRPRFSLHKGKKGQGEGVSFLHTRCRSASPVAGMATGRPANREGPKTDLEKHPGL